jgi:hypothetical protein
MTILRYVLAMANSIMTETCSLTAQSHMEYRLLAEFYWMLHKIPEYLVQTDCEDCCDKLRFLGGRKAGLQAAVERIGGEFCRCADNAAPHDAAAGVPREGTSDKSGGPGHKPGCAGGSHTCMSGTHCRS